MREFQNVSWWLNTSHTYIYMISNKCFMYVIELIEFYTSNMVYMLAKLLRLYLSYQKPKRRWLFILYASRVRLCNFCTYIIIILQEIIIYFHSNAEIVIFKGQGLLYFIYLALRVVFQVNKQNFF